jgi:hypothetical protein
MGSALAIFQLLFAVQHFIGTANVTFVMPPGEGFGLPFSISYEQHSFRLLELPPTLLDLITAKNPPSYVLSDCSMHFF